MSNLLVPMSLSGLISHQFYVHSGIKNASKTYKSSACFLHWFLERFCTDSGSYLAPFWPPKCYPWATFRLQMSAKIAKNGTHRPPWARLLQKNTASGTLHPKIRPLGIPRPPKRTPMASQDLQNEPKICSKINRNFGWNFEWFWHAVWLIVGGFFEPWPLASGLWHGLGGARVAETILEDLRT